MAGNALTTMSVFSSWSRGEPPPDPPDEHPAASIATAATDAMSRWRDFIRAPSVRRHVRPAIGWAAPCQAAAADCVTVIIMFRTVRHMPNDTTCPNLLALCYRHLLIVSRIEHDVLHAV